MLETNNSLNSLCTKIQVILLNKFKTRKNLHSDMIRLANLQRNNVNGHFLEGSDKQIALFWRALIPQNKFTMAPRVSLKQCLG